MKQGFVADKSGQVRISWVWNTDENCPYPDCLQLEEGDETYNADESNEKAYLEFHSDLGKHNYYPEKSEKEVQE